MKHVILNISAAILLLFTISSCKRNTGTGAATPLATAANEPNYADGQASPGRVFPDKLRDMPLAITASHYPNPCYAEMEDSMYVWKHNTVICAAEDMQLVEYGSFVYTKKGWYLRVKMTPAEFAESYQCKDALLKKGVKYTDRASWRRDKRLTGGDALWYFIAKDKTGRLVKGMAPIETEGKLLTALTKTATVISSRMTWTGYGEIGNYSLTGTVPLKQARIETDSSGLKSIAVSINIAGLKHDNASLEEHLKGADFFDVTKFAEASFESSQIIFTDATHGRVSGMLTIKEISKPIAFAVVCSQGKDFQKLSGRIRVDRTLFGIKFNSGSYFSGLGDQAIKNEFELDFEVRIR